MHKNFFDSETFITFSNEHLIIYNADFPREKKHQLAKELVKQNEELADRFNKEGHFPLTLLLDSNGNVLKTWNGLYKGTVDQFIEELK
jgi:thioredoxin-related protein